MKKQQATRVAERSVAYALKHAESNRHSGACRNPAVEHLELWSSDWLKKSASGRGSNGKLSPYGIQKLRELILELAVRGRLVPQDPSDEPAGVLLEKIAGEKVRLVKEGKIKRQKKLPEITEEEKPFELPDGWEWVRVRQICHDWGQKKPDQDFTYIDVSAIDNRSGRVVSPAVLTPDEAPSRARKIIQEGTVIYSTVRPYLKNIALVTEGFEPEPIASTAFAIVHPFSGILGAYLISVFRSPPFIRYVESVQTGIAYPAINDKQFFGAVIPLPPRAEQHRIVAKVDELMALCDRLEQEQTDSRETHQTLVETLLRTLVEAPNAETAQQAWQRIAQHFDLLFTTETAIDQLKQTILQLAVMGKLVPQDPNDKPASVLLEKIAEEKARLVKEGKIKKQKKLLEITEDEKPFELPYQWRWVRFGDVVNYKSELVKPNEFIECDQVGPDSIEKDTGRLLFRRTVRESGVQGPNNRFYAGQILYSKIRPSLNKVWLADFDGLCSADMYPLEPMTCPKYLVKTILSEVFLEQVRVAENRVKMPKLNIDSLSNILIPVPPLAEQHRIVAKVDELMALCDALKARIQESETTQRHLADAVVKRAVM